MTTNREKAAEIIYIYGETTFEKSLFAARALSAEGALASEDNDETVCLRRELEDLRDHYRTRSYPYGEVARDLTRILEGANDE